MRRRLAARPAGAGAVVGLWSAQPVRFQPLNFSRWAAGSAGVNKVDEARPAGACQAREGNCMGAPRELGIGLLQWGPLHLVSEETLLPRKQERRVSTPTPTPTRPPHILPLAEARCGRGQARRGEKVSDSPNFGHGGAHRERLACPASRTLPPPGGEHSPRTLRATWGLWLPFRFCWGCSV